MILFVDVVYDADIGMIQDRGGSRLPLEPFEGLRILNVALRQELERDGTTETDVRGLVDDTHAAAAEPLGDSIVRDRLADHSTTKLLATSSAHQLDFHD